MSEEEVMKYAEQRLNSNEEEKERTLKQLEALKNQQYSQSQELYDLRQKEANLISEISGTESASKNMQSQIHKY